MTEPTTMAMITSALALANKIADRTRTPSEKEKKKLADYGSRFEAYKVRPIEKRVNSYLMRLQKEIMILTHKLADKL